MAYIKPARRYNLTLLALILFNLTLIALFNRGIDPYGIWDSPVFLKVNKVKPQKDKQVKLFKAIEVNKIEPKIIFLGSSRTEFGLDPRHPALKSNGEHYNLGITATNMYEGMRYFEHAIAAQPDLKTVIVGIDFLMFNEFNPNKANFRDERLETNRIILPDYLSTLWSLNAFTASLKTIKTNIKEPKATGFYDDRGMRYPEYYIRHIYFNLSPKPISQKLLRQFQNESHLHKNYQLSSTHLEHLQKIVDICKKRGIELKIFISPAHAAQWDSIRSAGLWSVFEQWKREVIKLAPVWDFSGYNSITTEPIRGRRMKNYIESSHYRKEVGDLVLNRMFDYRAETVPEDFGVLITPENIEAHLEKIRSDREAWAKDNSDWVEFIESLKE